MSRIDPKSHLVPTHAHQLHGGDMGGKSITIQMQGKTSEKTTYVALNTIQNNFSGDAVLLQGRVTQP